MQLIQKKDIINKNNKIDKKIKKLNNLQYLILVI